MYVGSQVVRLLGTIFMFIGGTTVLVMFIVLFVMMATGQTLSPALIGFAAPAVVFLVLGGVFLEWGRRTHRRLTWLRNNGVPAQGRIIDKSTSSIRVNNFYYQIAHVQLPDGRRFSSEPFDDRKWQWEIGDLITVFVHPTDPTQGLVDLSPVIMDRWNNG